MTPRNAAAPRPQAPDPSPSSAESPALPALRLASPLPAIAPPRGVVDGVPATDASPGRYSRAGEIVKDVVDRLLAAVGLVIVSPLLLAVAIAIRLDSRGPALFRQVRVGRNGRPFTFYKYRGMYVDARERFPELYDYSYTNEEIRSLHFHSERDPRVTRVGRFIRRTSLDELPNLINVVLGDMSLVGPRPEIPELIGYYGPAAVVVLSVRPGITSLAKLVGRDHLTFEETLELDLQYVRTRSLALDVRILVGTVFLVLTGRSPGF